MDSSVRKRWSPPHTTTWFGFGWRVPMLFTPIISLRTCVISNYFLPLLFIPSHSHSHSPTAATPQHGQNINNQLHGVHGASPGNSISPKKLSMTPALAVADRPMVQKWAKNGKYRDSVTNMNQSMDELLHSYKNLEGWLKKKSSSISGWQKRYFVMGEERKCFFPGGTTARVRMMLTQLN